MKQYLEFLKTIITTGNIRTDRTNTGTISRFGMQMEFNLAEGLPLLTTKKIFLRGLIEENLWMLRGSTDNTELTDKNIHIWDQWSLRQEDLEYSLKERRDVLYAKVLKENDSVEMDTVASYYDDDKITNDSEALLTLLNKHQIPRLKPNPLGVKVGDLGPVYGEQWRFWGDPANDKELTLEERFQIAEDMLEAGVSGKFTRADWEFHYTNYNATNALCFGKLDSDPRSITFKNKLDAWGIPAKISKQATIDQITAVIDSLKNKPFSRRHIVSAWNVADLPDESISPQANVLKGKMALAPCHTLFQFYVENRTVREMSNDLSPEEGFEFQHTFFVNEIVAKYPDMSMMDRESPEYWEERFNFEKREKFDTWFKEHGVQTRKLSCKLYQRSADVVLGVPFNIAAYAIMTMMIAQCVDMVPGNFIVSFGDAHVYKNHLLPNEEGESVFTQLAREPFLLPQLWINPEVKNIFDFKYEDFRLENYECWPSIKFAVAI
jgi:thymidylate synthase